MYAKEELLFIYSVNISETVQDKRIVGVYDCRMCTIE